MTATRIRWVALLSTILAVSLLTVWYHYTTPAISDEPPASQPAQQPKTVTVQTPVQWRYLQYLPDDYQPEGAPTPLVLFLHGAGERGKDIDQVRRHGPPKLIDQGQAFPAIVISPQCPPGQWWNVRDLLALLDYLQAQFNVDKDRIYVTGLSMGGFGTWNLLAEAPDRFAAAVPICGGGNPKMAPWIKDIPIWAFHGEKDKTVKPEKTTAMVEAIQKAGGTKVKLTLYPKAGHDSWTTTYANPDLWAWLFKQQRRDTSP